MSESNELPQPIIKRIKKGEHGHHGGAWKVAYADFVTAMMAFFLLLWLLNATTEEQRVGISNYFAPGSVSKEASGAGGLLGGLSPNEKGAMSSSSPVHVTLPLPPIPQQMNVPGADQDAADAANGSKDNANNNGDEDFGKQMDQANGEHSNLSDKQKKQIAAAEQEKEFKEAEQELRQAMQAVPELRALKDSLIVDRTPDGMRIQIVDQDKLEMFPLGSAQMYDYTRKLMDEIAKVVNLTSNKIAISGHTDARPYTRGGAYGNWELSTDRANASRRALIDAGVAADRIARVVGRAETEPLLADDPLNARNRRISITLLTNAKSPS
jgi:chemotaxis protein MotB